MTYIVKNLGALLASGWAVVNSDTDQIVYTYEEKSDAEQEAQNLNTKMMSPSTITTTDGRLFTKVESVDLARLVFKRFGHRSSAATAAWCRLLQNDTTVEDFLALVDYSEHTPHCEGDCQAHQG